MEKNKICKKLHCICFYKLLFIQFLNCVSDSFFYPSFSSHLFNHKTALLACRTEASTGSGDSAGRQGPGDLVYFAAENPEEALQGRAPRRCPPARGRCLDQPRRLRGLRALTLASGLGRRVKYPRRQRTRDPPLDPKEWRTGRSQVTPRSPKL